MNSLLFTIVIHNHQPTGNWDIVFRKACDRCYLPFLDVLRRHPWFRCGMHFSGCLLEWAEDNCPVLLQRLGELLDRGQVELLGGGMYEPILTMLPERDRRGQIGDFSSYLRDRFGVSVDGAWVPERVWEQSLAHTLAQRGIRYTVLDDAHFEAAGLRREDISGYFLTEDQGELLRVFASDQNLRYHIPFHEPRKTIEYLRELSRNTDCAAVCYGDDGEKFGLWPGTYELCYEEGWLESFMEALRRSGDWLQLKKPSEVLSEVEPAGKIYLPDASYREMMEWSLPVGAQVELEKEKENTESAGGNRSSPRFKGGTWRNFRVRYAESAAMYGRMMEASRLVDRLPPEDEDAAAVRRELYRGQCNCAYWHGVFGGLYLPHLRRAVYARLIASTRRCEQILGEPEDFKKADFDMDGRQELKLNGTTTAAYLKPGLGGRCYELDLKEAEINLFDTKCRQREAYHRQLVESSGENSGDEGVKTIHERAQATQEGLERFLQYDESPRDSLVDHIVGDSATPRGAQECTLEEPIELQMAAYEVVRSSDSPRPQVTLERTSESGGMTVSKTVCTGADDAALEAAYRITPAGADAPEGLRAAVEFNLHTSARAARELGFYAGEGQWTAETTRPRALRGKKRITIPDSLLDLRTILSTRKTADAWMFPIYTVNKSEAGFELTYQCLSLWLLWDLDADGATEFAITLATENMPGGPSGKET